MAKKPSEKKYEFGFATITFDEGTDDEIKFDGQLCGKDSYMQADGGELELKPVTKEIELPELGDTPFDYIVVGWEGTLKVVGSKASLELISKTVSGTVTQKRDGKIVSITDAPIGSSMRENGRKVRLHPRGLGDDKSEDFVIHKVVNTEGVSKMYKNEQGKHEMEFSVLVKDCADPTKSNNYFYIGEDPDKISDGNTVTEEDTPS
ncbi:hypothetical protein ACWEWU_11770 [Staphylococcus xylosus]